MSLTNCLVFLAILLQLVLCKGYKSQSLEEGQRLMQTQPTSYIMEDGTNTTICEYPYKIKDTIFCQLELSEKVSKETQEISRILSVTSKTMSILARISGLISPGNPGPFCTVSLAEMLSRIRYMKVKYPAQLQRIFDLVETDRLELIPAFPDDAKNTLQDQPAYYTYGGGDKVNPSFFVNFWQQTINLIWIGVGISLCYLLRRCKVRHSFLNSFLFWMRRALKWNFFLMIFLTYYGDLVFYTSIEIRMFSLNSYLSVLSLVTCIFANIFGFFILGYVIYITRDFTKRDYSNDSLQSSSDQGIIIKWKDYKVLFARLKADPFIIKSFMPFFIVRIYLFNMIIGYLSDHPLVQSILMTILNLMMLVYMLVKKPFKECTEMTKHIVQEIVILSICVCIMTLTILDTGEIEAFDFRNALDGLIVCFTLTFNILGMSYLAVELMIEVKNIYYIVTKRSTNNSASIDTEAGLKIQRINRGLKKIEGSSKDSQKDLNSSQVIFGSQDNPLGGGDNDSSTINLKSSQLDQSTSISQGLSRTRTKSLSRSNHEQPERSTLDYRCLSSRKSPIPDIEPTRFESKLEIVTPVPQLQAVPFDNFLKVEGLEDMSRISMVELGSVPLSRIQSSMSADQEPEKPRKNINFTKRAFILHLQKYKFNKDKKSNNS